MDEIEITIVNWEKYNPQDFQTRYPHWFRLNKDLLQSPTVFGLSFEERWAWIGLMCLACERRTGKLTGSREWFIHRLQVSPQAFDITIQKLVSANSLATNWQQTPILLVPTEQNRTVQNRTIQNIRVSSELTFVSPRTPEHSIENLALNLSQDARDRIQRIYPDHEFVNREVEKMKIWLEANSKKMPKSKAGWTRFVMGWLERGWERYRRGIPSAKSGEINWDKIFKSEDDEHGQRMLQDEHATASE